MTDDHPALDERPQPDVAALRTETEWRSPADHFCQVCGCTKSGWADVPNVTSEWCEDLECRCHEDLDG